MKKLIAVSFVFALLVGVCACQKRPVANDSVQMTTSPTTNQSTSDPTLIQIQPIQPTDPKIVQMQELLNCPI